MAGGCQYIEGDPREGAPKCGAPTKAGSSYCRHHHRVCYLPIGSDEEKREIARFNALANNMKIGFSAAHIVQEPKILGDKTDAFHTSHNYDRTDSGKRLPIRPRCP